MSYLLDTHSLLWYFLAPEKLSPQAREVLADDDQKIYLSTASVWEIVIKYATGKLHLPDAPESYLPMRLAYTHIIELPITHQHALRVRHLPLIHKDPFDRLIIAQAQVESLTILSDDHVFTRYDIAVLW